MDFIVTYFLLFIVNGSQQCNVLWMTIANPPDHNE